ncbi:hypothetical protein F5884DRAFT_164391 [Xylogone sp. PMI_703]|nr:hypothetical protein F5884DRAFT_164391 [Xylogone sp. PMI_703]
MSTTAFTPRRSLARPRTSGTSSLNTASTPNLAASYNSPPSLPSAAAALGLRHPHSLLRKGSQTALTSGSLASIPDATEAYPLSTVLDEDTPSGGGMAGYTPSRVASRAASRAGDGGDIEVGDLVDVPGNMYGTVKFIGSVAGKKGVFAGVELSSVFASKGKNNGDVDGVSYFSTSIPGAGIFLPITRASRRFSSSPTDDASFPITPSTPSAGSVKLSIQTSQNGFTPPSLPKFSQSVGPGRAVSPQLKKTRSVTRPESPLRKPTLTTRPSLPKTPSRYGSPAPSKFAQSVRGTQDSRDPAKKVGYTPRSGLKASIGPGGPRSTSALGQMNFSDDDTTPVGVNRTATNGSLGSVSSFNQKMRPVSRANNDEEIERLRSQLDDRDRQLREQASTLAEMEQSLAEVQTLMGNADGGMRHDRASSVDDKDAAQLRALLREKNEKIAMLTAEFDTHRADFRSTIDTLELASTETERVYEKRVEELLQEIRELQDRSEDVDSVARQLKQLEELVQELEEGLEDARRGEAEARGEVEFLRGEVERTRSELRREKEKSAAALSNGDGSKSDTVAISKELAQRDDEIRGLKAIIHSLSRDAVPDPGNAESKGRQESNEERSAREKLEREVADLRAALESKSGREEELERELERLRRSSTGNVPNNRTSAMSTGTVTQEHRSSIRDSKGTVVSWRERETPRSPEMHRRGNTLETMPESDTYSSANESFCELCETAGHDILTCTNMFNGQGQNGTNAASQRNGKDVVKEGLKGLSPPVPQDEYKPAPLSPLKKAPSPAPPVKIIPNPMGQGPVPGKESGVVNPDKWCGVCENDGHDSIDCPFEDAF